jgi:MarR family transcriptional regulator, organic hydroperoxide resistance regulator
MVSKHAQLELDRQICFALYAASRSVVRAYGPLLADVGLTYPQYLAMLVLWESPEEPVSVGDLGARLQLDSGTLTPLLKRLEQAGYVSRRRDAADERRVLVGLTPDGVALADAVATIPGTLFAKLDLTSADARELRSQLLALARTLDDAGA